MKENIKTILIIFVLSGMLISCGQAEFNSLGSALEKLDSGDVTEQEVIDMEASDEQKKEVDDAISEVMSPEVKEPIEEVMAPEEMEPVKEVKKPKTPNTIDRVKMYLCKEEAPKKKVIKVKHNCCYVRDGSGMYVRDSNGQKVRAGFCDKHEEEVVVEEPKVQIPKYMICHAKPGMQSEGVSLCLPKAEIQAYIKEARSDGGTSYMGPCK